MKIKLAASMMCSNYANLESEIKDLEESEIDMLHCDIMDGHFVPNIIVGPDYIRTLRNLTKTKLDFHFMVENPRKIIALFKLLPGDRVSFHFETTKDPVRLISMLKDQGMEVGIAISPSQPLNRIIKLIEVVDFLHVMMVKPGFAGQSLLPSMMDRLIILDTMKSERKGDLDIEVDGSVLYENTNELIRNGATTLVLGPTNCFNRDLGIVNAVRKEKRIVYLSQRGRNP